MQKPRGACAKNHHLNLKTQLWIRDVSPIHKSSYTNPTSMTWHSGQQTQVHEYSDARLRPLRKDTNLYRSCRERTATRNCITLRYSISKWKIFVLVHYMSHTAISSLAVETTWKLLPNITKIDTYMYNFSTFSFWSTTYHAELSSSKIEQTNIMYIHTWCNLLWNAFYGWLLVRWRALQSDNCRILAERYHMHQNLYPHINVQYFGQISKAARLQIKPRANRIKRATKCCWVLCDHINNMHGRKKQKTRVLS